MAKQRLNVGVLLLPEGAQLLDLSPVDLFSMLSRSYLTACQLPAPITALGLPQINISYISEPEVSTIELTAQLHMSVTCDLNSSAVAPGQLDVLLIPGPDPSLVPSDAVKEFVRAHAAVERTEILTVCTGIFVAASAGILREKKVTAPRALLPKLRKQFPDTEWLEKRWVTDGKVWCSGGITNGLDMTAAYIRQRFPGPLADTVCALADVRDRGTQYETGKVREVAWWIWLIHRSWFRSLFWRS